MSEDYIRIQELLQQRADLQARLKLMPYVGTPEIKETASGRYIYMRKREAGKLTSSYVEKYSEELFQELLRYSKQARELKKNIRAAERELARLGYEDKEISARVRMNIDFARINIKTSIYDQAVLEGAATTFPQTEDIIDNGIVSGVSASDVNKILNLKHAWEFILDDGVVSYGPHFDTLSHIAQLVNEGFYRNGGMVRGVPVAIGGTSYRPPIPYEPDVRDDVEKLLLQNKEDVEIAIDLCLYVMKTQIFNDGNKRAAVLFASQFLITRGSGLLVVPENKVSEFKELLVRYYEGTNEEAIRAFMRTHCWRRMDA